MYGVPPVLLSLSATVHALRAALARERSRRRAKSVTRYTPSARLFPPEGVPETAHQARLGRARAFVLLEQVEALARRAYDGNTEAARPREHALVGSAPDEDGARARLVNDVHAPLEAVVDDDIEVERQGNRAAAAARGVDAGKVEAVPPEPACVCFCTGAPRVCGRWVTKRTSHRRSSASRARRPTMPGSVSASPSQKLSVSATRCHSISDCCAVNVSGAWQPWDGRRGWWFLLDRLLERGHGGLSLLAEHPLRFDRQRRVHVGEHAVHVEGDPQRRLAAAHRAPRRSSARRAASCSASFFAFPLAVPSTSPATTTSMVNCFR